MTIPPKLYPLVDRWLAEMVMGWTRIIIGEDGFKFGFGKWFDEEEQETKYEYLDGFDQNYWNPCTDLNDVKMCVDRMDENMEVLFVENLHRVVNPIFKKDYIVTKKAIEKSDYPKIYHYHYGILSQATNATAEQRVIALLLTLNEGKSLEEILEMIKEEYEV